jgi:Uma2 family endonuclease
MIIQNPSQRVFRIHAPPLHTGDHLSELEFQRRYEAYPGPERFELIEGIVYMMAPMRHPHGRFDRLLSVVFLEYEDATPGVETAGGITVLLGAKNVPEPDGVMYVLPEYGGQASISDDQYFSGAPEMVIEIAHSTVAIDLHDKRTAYKRAGVLEYMVVCIEEKEVVFLNLPLGKRIKPDSRGILKSQVFPGLWLDTKALFDRQMRGLKATIRRGLNSPEHTAFVKTLRSRHEATKSLKQPSAKRSARKGRD